LFKNLCKGIINYIGLKYFEKKFFNFFKKIKDDDIYVFDLDNTIANTWVSYLQKYNNHRDRLKSLSIFLGMKNHINAIKSGKIIILTAREYWYSCVTKEWLDECGINYDLLIIVPKPINKKNLLSSISTECIYYDDMSYNQEKGKIKFYEEEIKALSKMKNIKYVDYKEIKEINGES
jgi:hypothetical protein